MIPPAVAARQLLAALALGGLLGLAYGFLRPLRPRHTVVADLLFCLAGFWAWLQLNFGVCLGDIRFGCNAVMVASGIVFDCTLGRYLRGIFDGFWKLWRSMIGLFLRPFRFFCKKIRKSAKKLLCRRKKDSTIRCKTLDGGNSHGITEKAT